MLYNYSKCAQVTVFIFQKEKINFNAILTILGRMSNVNFFIALRNCVKLFLVAGGRNTLAYTAYFSLEFFKV